METKGYIKVFRRLHNHWLWEDKPFGKGQAWVDLMLLASYCTSQFRHGNQVKVVHRGTMLTSVQKLAARWGWSTKKVGNFLKLLEDERMVIKRSYKTHTTITLLNYDQWQGEVARDTPDEPLQDSSKETSEGPSRESWQAPIPAPAQGNLAETPQPIDITAIEQAGETQRETRKTHAGNIKGQWQGLPSEHIQEVKEVKEVKKIKDLKKKPVVPNLTERRAPNEPHQQGHGNTDQYQSLNICLAKLNL